MKINKIPTFRGIKPGEEPAVCDFVTRVFNNFVAPLYSKEGAQEFLKYVDPVLLYNRIRSNHFVLIAELQSRMVGMIEVRNFDHISLFFVDGEMQRKGIGKQLFLRCLEKCIANLADLHKITVHSSPNAAEVYRLFGFQAEGPEQTINEIRFVPMSFILDRTVDGRG